ncbi:peptide deformylase [Bacteroidetes bacterium SCGC AAA795-G10]|nr:peptide deformylase [Bacteroidetes bacterium SCGC AAA795-G10]
MILPILGYGSPILKKAATDISPQYPNLNELISNMWDTMYAAKGVGLAAPQIGLSIRLFVIDATPFLDDENMDDFELNSIKNFKKVFINPKIIEENGNLWEFNEGCLSIPEIREDVSRRSKIVIEYFDENFQSNKLKLSGLAARVVQHEYDHIEGILFIDHLSSLKKRLIKGKLNNISSGSIKVDYEMKFNNRKLK